MTISPVVITVAGTSTIWRSPPLEPHIKVFRAHRALGIFYGVLLTGIYIAMVLPSGGAKALEESYFLLFGLTIAGAHLATAYACKRRSSTGRVFSILIGLLMLFAFPIGTIIGIYLLLNTWQSWSDAFE